MNDDPCDTKAVIDRFNEAFLRHEPALLDDLVADDCVLENTSPAPDGDLRHGRQACLEIWRGIAANRGARFELEEVRVMGDHALVFWRYRWGPAQADSNRGINVMRVRGARIVHARGYVKQVPQGAPA